MLTSSNILCRQVRIPLDQFRDSETLQNAFRVANCKNRSGGENGAALAEVPAAKFRWQVSRRAGPSRLNVNARSTKSGGTAFPYLEGRIMQDGI